MIKRFLSKNFLKYFLVGILATLFSTASLVVLVDYCGMWVGFANPLVVAVNFVLKYLLYDKVGMLNNE